MMVGDITDIWWRCLSAVALKSKIKKSVARLKVASYRAFITVTIFNGYDYSFVCTILDIGRALADILLVVHIIIVNGQPKFEVYETVLMPAKKDHIIFRLCLSRMLKTSDFQVI